MAGYDILDVLGRGGMGVVYKARQHGLNRLVALKMLPSGIHADRTGLSRFRAEAEAIANLQHPNIVQVYEVGEYDGLPYFSLEYLDGGSLQQRLAGRPLSPCDAATLAEQLARAVQYAHERGIVHRDLKPGNILFQKSDIRHPKSEMESSDVGCRMSDLSPKITDFGLARRLEGASDLTDTGTILGTPSYMAPEQAEGRSHDIGPPADIHALGAILYEVLTGRPPFLAADPTATVMQVRLMEPVPPRRIQPEVPRDLETITLKCLQKEPHKRYATAGELADDLQRFLNGTPILARPVSIWEKLWKWARRKPAAFGLAIFSVVVAFGLAVGGPVIARREHQLRTVAVEERDKAEQQFRRAEQNFFSAREAVEQLLTRIGDERLSDVPKAEKLRSALLEDALVFYGRFLRESDDPAVRQEAGWAYQRVGRIREQLGQRSAAIAAYQKAAELFARLESEAPHDPGHRSDLADTHRLLAVILEADGQRTKADRSHDIARDLLVRLVAEHPEQPDYRLRLVALLNNRGNQLGHRRQLAEAEGQFRVALTELDQLCTEFPIAAHRLERARVQSSLGALLLIQNQIEPALTQLRAAVNGLADLMRDETDRFVYVQELGRAFDNLGVALQESGRGTAAETALRSAVETLTGLANNAPGIPEYRFALALALDNLAHLRKTTGGLRAAESERARARALWAELAREVPDNDDYQFHYALSLDEHGIYLEEIAGRREEAFEAVGVALDRLQALAAADPTNLRVAHELARRHLNLGILLTRDRHEAEAEEHYTQARFLLDNLLARRPVDDKARLDLITVHTNRAALLRHLGRPREEEGSWRRVAELQAQRIDTFPTSPDLAADLAQTQFTLASLCSDRPEEALAVLRAAVARQRVAVKLAPRRTELVADLGQYGAALLAALVDEGDHAATAQMAGQLAADLPLGWDGWPRVAGLLCRCMKLAQNDSTLSAEVRARAAQSYGEQALGLLRRAVAAGYKDVSTLKNADDLEPLRNGAEFRAAFAQLVAEAEIKHGGG